MPVIRPVLRFLGKAATVLIALLLVCNLYVLGARVIGGVSHPTVFGWSWAVVVSGSMEPAIQVNDLVVIHRQERYETGDVITFLSGNLTVTHRITGQTPNGFTTKGDANNIEDPTVVKETDVIGKVVLVIPAAGRVIELLRTPLGMLCLVAAGFALIEVPYLIELKARKKE